MSTNSNDQPLSVQSEIRDSMSPLEKSVRAKAKSLDQNRVIYHIWSPLDALSSANSMSKYGEQLFSDNPEIVQDAMHTPGAIIGVTLETLLLVSIASVASWYDKKEDNNARIQLIVYIAPLLRELIKGLKNAYKGWRSAVLAFKVLDCNLIYLITPIGIVLGIIAAIERALLLRMKENRKSKMGINIAHIKKLKELTTLSEEEKNNIEIATQSIEVLVAGYIGVALNGFIDGLYLYVGVLSLAALAPPLLAAMLGLCAVFTTACVISRIYENYDFELKLSITETQTRLKIIDVQMRMLYKQWMLEKARVNDPSLMMSTSELQALTDSLEQNINGLIDQFDVMRRILINQSTHSYLTASLSGLKSALNAYSAFTSLMFLVYTILLMNASAFPPALLLLTVVAGMGLIIGFIGHSIREKYKQAHHMYSSDESFCSEQLKNEIKSKLATEQSFKEKINLGLDVAPPEVNSAPDWFESVRAGDSGLGKGEKFAEFIGVHEQVTAGHSHDQHELSETPFLWIVDLLFSLIFGSVMFLKALAKGIGRDPLGKISLVDEGVTPANKTTQRLKEAAPMPSCDETHGARPENKAQKDIITQHPEIEVTTLPPLSNGSNFDYYPNKLPKFKRSPTLTPVASKSQPNEKRPTESLNNAKLNTVDSQDAPTSTLVPSAPVNSFELDPVDTLSPCPANSLDNAIETLNLPAPVDNADLAIQYGSKTYPGLFNLHCRYERCANLVAMDNTMVQARL